jgi:predicted Rdx family selenoprotein
LAARISKEFGIEPELIKGGNGIFDMVADNKLIFSKPRIGRFPDEEKIIKLLRK